MHARVPETIQGSQRIIGKVCREATGAVRHRDRAHAVLEDVNLASQLGVTTELGQEVVDGALHAVAGRLSGEHDHVVGEQHVDEPSVLGAESLPVKTGPDLLTKDAVALAERVPTLDLAVTLHSTHVTVEEPSLGEHAGHGVTGRAQQGVGRPQVQGVLATARELLDVVTHLLHQPGVVGTAQPPGHLRPWLHVGDQHLAVQTDVVEHTTGALHDQRVRAQRLTSGSDPERGGEDLQREVRVEGRVDPGDQVQVPVEEVGQPHGVVDGACTRSTRHKERAVRVGEVLLAVDGNHGHLDRVGPGSLDSMRRLEGERVDGQLGHVRSIAEDLGVLGVKVTRGRKGTHCFSPFFLVGATGYVPSRHGSYFISRR